jgi:hypothetical protein
MMDLATEEQHLAKAERDIAEGEARIARQADLVGRLQDTGQDASAAQELLISLQQTLGLWQDHRAEILRAINWLTREAGTSLKDR